MARHRHRARTTATLLGALGLALGLALAGCTSGSTTTVGPSADESGGDTTLRIGLNRTIGSLDPGEGAEGNATGSVKAALYSSLTWLDADGKLVGDLATSWEQTSDTQWTFTIRDDARFSDGTAVDAPAIKANFDRLLDPDSTLEDAGNVRPFLEKAEAPDATTLVLTTKYPFLRLPERLTAVFYGSPSFLAQGQDLAVKAVGSGPYLLESVDPENGAVLVANPDFYGPTPEFTRVEYTALPTETARVSAVQTSSVDFINGLDPLDLVQFNDSSTYDTEVTPSYWVQHLRINTAIDPVKGPLVRQAINYGIDKEALIKAFLADAVEPSPGQVLVPGYETSNPNLKAYPYDPDKARSLLAEAGYTDGVDLELVYPDGSYLAGNSISEAIASQLAQVNIRVKLAPSTFLNFIGKTEDPTAGPLFYQGWGGNYPVASERLRLYAGSHQNVHVPDPEYDQYVEEAARATTPEAEQEAVNKARQRQFDQAHLVYRVVTVTAVAGSARS